MPESELSWIEPSDPGRGTLPHINRAGHAHLDMPVDCDVDISIPLQRSEMVSHHLRILGSIAAGGVIGALARFQIGRWWPAPSDGFPAATLTINLVGCFLIGVLMVLVTEIFSAHPLIRPFVGTGILGGFTTFSTYAVDIRGLLAEGRPAVAVVYLFATAVGAILAVASSMAITRRATSHVAAGQGNP